jgi:dolichyldiphosphatase
MVMYTTLILFRRDWGSIYTLFGQMINLIINKILKKTIEQPRPDTNNEMSDSGMPSNHAQFIGYCCAFHIIQVLINSNKYISAQYRILYSILLIFVALGVCLSRIYLEYHTFDQVVVGLFVGIIFGIIWAVIDIIYGTYIGTTICSMPIVKWLGFINYSPLEEYVSLRGFISKVD